MASLFLFHSAFRNIDDVSLSFRYGIEGFVYTAPSASEPSIMAFDPDNATLSYEDVCIRMLSPAKVQITIDESSVAGLRQRLRLSLVSPAVPGLSVSSTSGK
jgi:hypothetical protein